MNTVVGEVTSATLTGALVSPTPVPEAHPAAHVELKTTTETKRPPGKAGTVGWGLIVGAGVALGLGTAFGIRAMAAWDSVEQRCNPDACLDRRALDDADTARTTATISNVAFGGAVALAAVGVMLVLTGKK